MANYSKDWRDTERDLSELPDAQLREALAQAGVKAVLPSHKKPRGLVKPVGRLGDATSRWAAGDWEERISLDELPDAQKFLADPLKPPTIAVAQSTALSSAPGAGSPWRGAMIGLAATAALAGLSVFALKESDLLDRPRVGARSVQTAAALPAAAPPASPAPSKEIVDTEPAMAAPAGSTDHNQANAQARADELEKLQQKAGRGDEAAMLDLARAMLKDGDADGAMRWAGRARRANRRSVEARIVLGDAQMLAGYGKAATQTWRGALARSPHNKELKRRLGEW